MAAGIRRTPDPDDGRSGHISLTEVAGARLPQACAVLFQGNREVLSDFTDEEAAQPAALLTRPITNRDRVINADAPLNKRTKKASNNAPKTRPASSHKGRSCKCRVPSNQDLRAARVFCILQRFGTTGFGRPDSQFQFSVLAAPGLTPSAESHRTSQSFVPECESGCPR